MLFAHVKWFVETAPSAGLRPAEWGLVVLLTGSGLAVLYWLRQPYRYLDRIAKKYLSGLWTWVTPIVRLSAGFSLILNSVSGYVLAPNLTGLPVFFNYLFFILGVLLILGLAVRPAAAGLVPVRSDLVRSTYREAKT